MDLIYALGVAALLLWSQVSARIRDWAEERTHSRALPGDALCRVSMCPSSRCATLPLTLYEGFFREHAYGLSNQNFLAMAGRFRHELRADAGRGADLRCRCSMPRSARARESWWLWGAGLAILFQIIGGW